MRLKRSILYVDIVFLALNLLGIISIHTSVSLAAVVVAYHSRTCTHPASSSTCTPNTSHIIIIIIIIINIITTSMLLIVLFTIISLIMLYLLLLLLSLLLLCALQPLLSLSLLLLLLCIASNPRRGIQGGACLPGVARAARGRPREEHMLYTHIHMDIHIYDDRN